MNSYYAPTNARSSIVTFSLPETKGEMPGEAKNILKLRWWRAFAIAI
jgi:hypothetical protein